MEHDEQKLKIVADDPWLEPVSGELALRHRMYLNAMDSISREWGSLTQAADAYRYFGFNYDEELCGWWFREWLPDAKDVFLFGDFNGWQRTELRLSRGQDGVWSTFLPDALYRNSLTKGSLYKIHVHGADGSWRDRIPAYATRVVQDETTKNFTAQFTGEDDFDWSGDDFSIPENFHPLIYECHVGMSQEKEGVATYDEFTDSVLPRIKRLGYNAVQLMAVAEHPYYGSFGYHVSSFFAPTSRCGTAEQLKNLIRTAHSMGLAVIMDVVHSHFVKNLNEGIFALDGNPTQYTPAGEAGYHKYWDSRCFDYRKPQVLRFLLSNLKYWIREFRFDGFRFDGVTSMIYTHHGYTEFDSREKFFDDTVNRDALCYLTLANRLVHLLRPDALTIAEDVSGMPGMTSPIDDGGVGFDYRLGMAVPDFWIKMLKDLPDQKWNIWDIWNILTSRLPSAKTIAYAESHDQALVGDKTIAFRLMDKEMYTAMDTASRSIVIDRGMALHKMIRLVTATAGGQGYLNFMGNEFGHPEWIDFPRQGNGWSYAHARRQWSLASDEHLRYRFLEAFDAAMLKLIKDYDVLADDYPYRLQMDEGNKTMVYSHRNLVFVFNFHSENSIPDYAVRVPQAGRYRLVLSTDEQRFGGQGRQDTEMPHFSFPSEDGTACIRIYNVCRTAGVYEKLEEPAP